MEFEIDQALVVYITEKDEALEHDEAQLAAEGALRDKGIDPDGWYCTNVERRGSHTVFVLFEGFGHGELPKETT